MIEAPTLDNESQRGEALDAAMCAFVPREERFDRITRTVKRLLDVPLALISIVERDVQWFRSAQGLLEAETPRSISFCGHAIASKKPLVVPDATSDPRRCTSKRPQVCTLAWRQVSRTSTSSSVTRL